MPIYEYRCDDCGHQQEFMQKFAEPPIEVCPACGARRLRKLLSAAGFQLKGTGWYVTDFRGTKNAPATQDKDEGGKKPEAKPEASSAGKSDAASGAKPAESAAN
jgi:putative FmdB family regulatory protein